MRNIKFIFACVVLGSTSLLGACGDDDDDDDGAAGAGAGGRAGGGGRGGTSGMSPGGQGPGGTAGRGGAGTGNIGGMGVAGDSGGGGAGGDGGTGAISGGDAAGASGAGSGGVGGGSDGGVGGQGGEGGAPITLEAECTALCASQEAADPALACFDEDACLAFCTDPIAEEPQTPTDCPELYIDMNRCLAGLTSSQWECSDQGGGLSFVAPVEGTACEEELCAWSCCDTFLADVNVVDRCNCPAQ